MRAEIAFFDGEDLLLLYSDRLLIGKRQPAVRPSFEVMHLERTSISTQIPIRVTISWDSWVEAKKLGAVPWEEELWLLDPATLEVGMCFMRFTSYLISFHDQLVVRGSYPSKIWMRPVSAEKRPALEVGAGKEILGQIEIKHHADSGVWWLSRVHLFAPVPLGSWTWRTDAKRMTVAAIYEPDSPDLSSERLLLVSTGASRATHLFRIEDPAWASQVEVGDGIVTFLDAPQPGLSLDTSEAAVPAAGYIRSSEGQPRYLPIRRARPLHIVPLEDGNIGVLLVRLEENRPALFWERWTAVADARPIGSIRLDLPAEKLLEGGQVRISLLPRLAIIMLDPEEVLVEPLD